MDAFVPSPGRIVAPLLAALALCAAAPDGAPDRELPPVTAEGHPEPTEEARSSDPSAFATVIEPRPGEPRTTAELVQASPGVTLRDFGLNQSATVSVRGSSSDQVVVLLDGLPLNAVAGGGTDLSTLPAPFIERLTVSRGVSGARHGSAALGGALLLETRRPEPGEQRLTAELSVGSFETGQANLAAAGSRGRFSGMLSLFGSASRGDFPYPVDDQPQIEGNPLSIQRRENNQARRAGALARAAWDGPVELDLLVEADGGERGLPGTVQAPSAGAWQADRRGLLAGRATREVGGAELSLRLDGRLGRLELGSRPEGEPSSQDEARWGGELSAKMLAGRHALEAGAGLARESLDGAAHGSNARGHAFAWIADEAVLGPFSLLPALRAESLGDHRGLSSKLGASWLVAEPVTLKGNVGRSFRAPSFGELYLEQGLFAPNPKLRSERASFADLGAELESGPIRAAASGFYTLYDDLILYELYAPMRAKPFNFGKAWVYGAEAELTGRAGPFAASASYTLAFSANRLDDPRYFNRDLPYHPRHRAHARAETTFDRWSASVEADVQSAQYTNRTNTDQIPARLRLDAGAAVRLHRGSGLWLHGTVKNLLGSYDEDLFGYPLPGRAFYASLRIDLPERKERSPQ